MQCCAGAARGIAMTQTYRAVLCCELRPRDVLRIKHLPQSPFAPGPSASRSQPQVSTFPTRPPNSQQSPQQDPTDEDCNSSANGDRDPDDFLTVLPAFAPHTARSIEAAALGHELISPPLGYETQEF